MPFPLLAIVVVAAAGAILSAWAADRLTEKKKAPEETKPLFDMLDIWSQHGIPGMPRTDEEYANRQTSLIQNWALNKGLPLSLYLPGKSPITPAEAQAEASAIIDKGLALIAILNTIGITAEVASLGQVESVIWAMMNLVNASGVPTIIGDLYRTPVDIGVKIPLERRMHSIYQSMLPDSATLSELRARGMLSGDAYNTWMREHGYPDWASEMMAYAKTRFPAIPDLLSMTQRGILSETGLKTWLRRSGLHPDTIDAMVKLRWQLPGYQDIISIYMREGYLPEKWVEIPSEFLTYLQQLGYSAEWAKRLWGKHWVLPGVSLLYEMFQKEIIDRPTLIQMLRYHDFEPVWRERLLANAYTMIPRVDLRRAYRYGFIWPEVLEQRYRWLGYNPDDARIMAGIAQRESLTAYYSQIESQARSLFKEGLMSEDEFRGWLRKSGLPERAIDLAVDAENLAYRLDYAKDLQAMYVVGYTKDVFTAEELTGLLADLGMQPDRIQALVALEQFRKLPKPGAG